MRVYFVTVDEQSRTALHFFQGLSQLSFPWSGLPYPQLGGFSQRLRSEHTAAAWCPLRHHSKQRVRDGGESRNVISPSTGWEELESDLDSFIQPVFIEQLLHTSHWARSWGQSCESD